MNRKRILFQGSLAKEKARGADPSERSGVAVEISTLLGEGLIRAGFDVVLTGSGSLVTHVGASAAAACESESADPKDRIRTYVYPGDQPSSEAAGMVIQPLAHRWQDFRTFVVREADAIVAVAGGKGTADVLQKAALARLPLLPVAIAGGGAQAEWTRLHNERYCNRESGDIDFLGDTSAAPTEMTRRIVQECQRLLGEKRHTHSRRIFVVHGRDDSLKTQLARLLERLSLKPVILSEQPDSGRTIFEKLRQEFRDVGYAFVLLTPDDVGTLAADPGKLQARARQNVVFEHGWLVGSLGPSRVCAIVKGNLEIPSDLHGIVYKPLLQGQDLNTITFELIRELRIAGYDVDANALLNIGA